MSLRVQIFRVAAGILFTCTFALSATKPAADTHTPTPTTSAKDADSDKGSDTKNQDTECNTTEQVLANVECMEQGIENIREKYDKLSKDKTSDGKPMPVGVEEDFEIESGLNSMIHRLFQDMNLPPEELKKLESLEKEFFKVPHGAKDTAEREKQILESIASNLTKQLDEKGIDPSDKKRLALQKAIETKMGYNNLKKNSADGSTTYIGYGKPEDKPIIESIPIKPAKPETADSKLPAKANTQTPGTANLIGSGIGGFFGGSLGGLLGHAAGGAIADSILGNGTSGRTENPSAIGPTLDRPFGLNLFPNNPQPPTETDSTSKDSANNVNTVAPKTHENTPVEEPSTDSGTDKTEAPPTKDGNSSTAWVATDTSPTPNSNPPSTDNKIGATGTSTPSTVATGTPTSPSQLNSAGALGTNSSASQVNSGGVAGSAGNSLTAAGQVTSAVSQGMQNILGSIQQFFSNPSNTSSGRHADDSVSEINTNKDSSSLTQAVNEKQSQNQQGDTGSATGMGFSSLFPSNSVTNSATGFTPQTIIRGFDAGFFNTTPLEVKDLNNVTALKVGQLPGALGDIETPLPGSLKTDIIETPIGRTGDTGIRGARTLAAIPTSQGIGTVAPATSDQETNQFTTPVISRRSGNLGKSTSGKAPIPLISDSANNTVDYEPAVAVKTETRRPKKSGPANPDDYYNDEVVISPTDTKLLAKLRELNNVELNPPKQRELASLEQRVLTTDKDFLETSGLPKNGEVQDVTTLQSGVLLPSLAPFASSFETLGLKPMTNMLSKPATRLIEQLSKDFESAQSPLTTQLK